MYLFCGLFMVAGYVHHPMVTDILLIFQTRVNIGG